MRTSSALPGRTRRIAPFAAAAVLTLSACAAVSGDTRPGPSAAPAPGDPASGQDGRGGGGSAAAEEPGGSGPLAGMTVVVDPGHNGGNAEAPEAISEQVPAGPATKECDTVGAETDDGYPEHEFTWELSTLVAERLEADGAEVVLTREDNTGVGPCVDERAEIGNDAGADAAVSIHADGGPPSGRGFHVIAPGVLTGYTDDIAEPSRRLAADLRDAFEDGTGQPRADYIAEEGLDERTDLGGLNMSDVPKVFLEAGNMSNPTDAENLADPGWQADAADAIAAGVSRFLTG
ncbi:N-acetylmuramoyl-L-alanine amidase [Streptomonospora nanhaiensis]|uniref:N-acetylmuramoyl-L-alanine amidase n=1 Tax=Streptomonospora nanhaiensis TaxID=1323731 RepID=A0A853BNN2_9ACTN|nr:N-acetylmuramoyl-L-alanine amidase [Streptomonospora nanhaiensis]MBV2365945.1 N-acetylmuramoyl-L-alanine amidase [Streptomonospora nanhaiensis]MBX9391713.1 N-acetylmuramoyl-L-alanine amidase [Streptomonospora nanhaiensis]NYI96620.1 N-acetylmuramoyl-L-alanine amidase [Streptomonospora nanhaiensis]